jgi:hypothetical protein
MNNANVSPVPLPDAPFRLFRENQRREDGLSSSLQLTKAGEHLVCCELILRGHNAFLADAGQPYDVLVDAGIGRFVRVQVKVTSRMYTREGYYPAYRFAFRKSRTGDRRITPKDVDVFALVALDARQIAWLPVDAVLRAEGFAKTLIELKTRRLTYAKVGRSGTDPAKVGRWMEDYATFPVPLLGRSEP